MADSIEGIFASFVVRLAVRLADSKDLPGIDVTFGQFDFANIFCIGKTKSQYDM